MRDTGTQCALNSSLIGTYKANVLGFRHTQTFRHLNVFVPTYSSGFEHTPGFSMKSIHLCTQGPWLTEKEDFGEMFPVKYLPHIPL